MINQVVVKLTRDRGSFAPGFLAFQALV